MTGYPRYSAGFSAAALMVLVAMIITTPTVAAEEADGSTEDENDPWVLIEMDKKVMTVRVEPGQNCLVIFTGFMEVWHFGDWSDIENTSIELQATSENGYSTKIRPRYYNYSHGSCQFTVSVRVPPATLSSTVDTVSIGGVCTDLRTGSQEKISGEDLSIIVEQYHRFGVSLEEEYIVTRGGLVDYYMTIHNMGNGPDHFGIEVDDPEDLKENDLTVAISSPSVLIDADETKTVRIGVASGDETENLHVHAVALRVSSMGAREDGLPLAEQIHLYYRLNDYWRGPEGFAGLIAFIILLMVMVVFVVRRRRRKMVKFRLANRRDE